MIKKDLDWNDTSVLKLQPDRSVTSNDTMVWHPSIARFGIRFRREPGKDWKRGTYTVEYYKGGRDRRVSLDMKVGEVRYEDAREKAQKILLDAADPAKDPRLEIKKAKAVHSELFKIFVPSYIAHMRVQALSEAHISRTEDYLLDYFPSLLEMPVKLIERSHVADALLEILNEDPENPVPIAMTRARAALSAFMGWLRTQGKIEYNPVDGTTRYDSETIERSLSPEELAIVWNAASPDWEFGRIVRLVILTGARKTQLGSLKKSELRRDQGMIVLPKKASLRQRRKAAALGGSAPRRGGSKNGEEFIIPLSTQAQKVLAMQPERKDSSYIFGEDGEGGFSGWSNSMTALYTRIGTKMIEIRGLDPKDPDAQAICHWTMHDLRRTFDTLIQKHCEIAPGVKVQPHVADAAINHKPKVKAGVAGIYNQGDFMDERSIAMQLWGNYVENLVTPKLKVVTA